MIKNAGQSPLQDTLRTFCALTREVGKVKFVFGFVRTERFLAGFSPATPLPSKHPSGDGDHDDEDAVENVE